MSDAPPETYSELLHRLNRRKTQAESEFKQRCRDFEKESVENSNTNAKAGDEVKQLKLNAIQERGEKSLRDIEKKREEHCLETEEKKKAIRSREKALLEARSKEFDEIADKHMKEMEAEKMELEKVLNEHNAKLEEAKQNGESVLRNETEKTEAKKDSLNKEQKERDAAHFDELLNEKKQGLDAQLRATKDVAEKRNEYDDKKIALRKEEHETQLSAMSRNISTLLINNSMRNAATLNDMMGTLENLIDDASSALTGCQYFFNDHDWNESQLKRAETSFNSLSTAIGKISKHLTDMKRKLADMPNDDSKKEKEKKIQDIQKLILQASPCIAGFPGSLMVKKMTRDQERENKLLDLMNSIFGMIVDFGGFENQRSRMLNHLHPSTGISSQSAKAVEGKSD